MGQITRREQTGVKQSHLQKKIPGDSVFEEYKQKNDDEIQHIKMYLYEKCVRASEQ
jgi:hypothetical protein